MYPLTDPNSTLAAAAILVAAALLHATFQLSVSVMTLMSGHALGRKHSHLRLLNLCLSYIAGNLLMTVLLVLGALYILSALFLPLIMTWLALAVIGIFTGMAVLFVYYRPGKSQLWIPHAAAEYLYERSKKTKNSAEAFGLGLMTGMAELPFIATPLLLAAMVLRGNPDLTRLGAALGYALVASLPLLILLTLIGNGTKVSHIERWRENNRRFMNITSGLGLVILSTYVVVLYCSNSKGLAVW